MNPMRPLTDTELDRLDQVLLGFEELDEPMDISTLDGFLTAILCCARTIPPSEWMPWVWDMKDGRQSPRFKTKKDLQRVLELLVRHSNDIASTLLERPDSYAPLLCENPNDGDPVPIIDEWCCGFVTGMRLDTPGWARVPPGLRAGLADIERYGTEAGWAELEALELSLAQHRAIAEGLADTVRAAHAQFLGERMREQAIRPPSRLH